MTPNGPTSREEINKIVMQGEVLGPIECSATVDTIGKECLEKQKYLYSYKGLVGVPPLAMVDDLACISVCGLETVQMNGFLNAKTSIKKLRFGEDKCHRMHIGRHNSYCPDLFIDKWKVKLVLKMMTQGMMVRLILLREILKWKTQMKKSIWGTC